MGIAENIARVREQSAAAAIRAGRDPGEVKLMAVTKTVLPERMREAYEAGIRLFGENRVQEFAAKVDSVRDLTDAQWHMIGHLQSNKAAHAVEMFSAIDSVDSVRLARKVNNSATERQKKISVLMEVNIGGEEAKSGMAPDSSELHDLLNAAPELSSLAFQGLMTVPPYSDNPEDSRPYFREMRELFRKIAQQQPPAVQMNVLSMGMSHDFEVAVEEGSTCVRLGTAIFGARPPLRSHR